MPRPVTSILAKLMEFANKEMVVACPECHEKIRIVRNGRYWRYAYHLKKAIGIQRHLCRNHQCKRRSFSILPFPLLPYLRVTATFMVVLVLIHTEESARNISRQMDLVRSSVRRWRKRGEQLVKWLTVKGALCEPGISWAMVGQGFYRARLPLGDP